MQKALDILRSLYSEADQLSKSTQLCLHRHVVVEDGCSKPSQNFRCLPLLLFFFELWMIAGKPPKLSMLYLGVLVYV